MEAATVVHVCVQVRARQLWGNEIYTQDSDLVAVIMHLGYYNHSIASPPAGALEVRGGPCVHAAPGPSFCHAWSSMTGQRHILFVWHAC